MRNLALSERLSLPIALMGSGRFLKRTPYYSREQMREWQWKKITRLVRHAYENVSFYRDLYNSISFNPADLRSWDDFHRLPIVTKDQVIAHFPQGIIAEGYDLEKLVVSRSSGSSGKVLDIAYDSRAMLIYMLAGLRLYNMGFKYRPWHRQTYIYTSPYPMNSLLGLYPLDFVSTLAPIADIIATLKTTHSDLLVCYPSHLKQIEQELSDDDLRVINPRCISVNSEMSTQAERDYLATRFGCPVLDEYSSEELTRIAAQCRHHTYHIFEDINYLESSETDQTLIGTNLHNYAMPMIRYQQNDLGHIEDKDCECGWKFRTLVDLQGRRNDSFTMPSGRLISSGFLLDATYEILLTWRTAVKDFCLIQEKEDLVVLEVVPGEGWNSEIGYSIEQRFAGFFESSVKFKIAMVAVCQKTKSGKRNPIISRVANASII